MPRRYRIILLLMAGTLAVVVFLTVGRGQTDSASYTYGWRDRMSDLYYDFKYSLPWNRGRRPTGNSCHSNLLIIDGAKATWALENKKTNSDIPTTNELYGATNYIRAAPYCPEGGSYMLGRVDERVRCSIPGHTL